MCNEHRRSDCAVHNGLALPVGECNCERPLPWSNWLWVGAWRMPTEDLEEIRLVPSLAQPVSATTESITNQ